MALNISKAHLVLNGFLNHALCNLTLVGIPKDHDLGHLRLSLPVLDGELVFGHYWPRSKCSVQLIFLL